MLNKEDRKIIEVVRVRLRKTRLKRAEKETGIPRSSLRRIRDVTGVCPRKGTIKKLALWVCRKVVEGK